MRIDEGEDAGNEGDACHQDGPQAQAASFNGRFNRIGAFVLFVLGEFHDQDRVFAGEADQHD